MPRGFELRLVRRAELWIRRIRRHTERGPLRSEAAASGRMRLEVAHAFGKRSFPFHRTGAPSEPMMCDATRRMTRSPQVSVQLIRLGFIAKYAIMRTRLWRCPSVCGVSFSLQVTLEAARRVTWHAAIGDDVTGAEKFFPFLGRRPCSNGVPSTLPFAPAAAFFDALTAMCTRGRCSVSSQHLAHNCRIRHRGRTASETSVAPSGDRSANASAGARCVESST